MVCWSISPSYKSIFILSGLVVRLPLKSVAGSETTSVTLRMSLLCLLTTPAAYRKTQAEIDAIYAKRASSSDSSATPTRKPCRTPKR